MHKRIETTVAKAKELRGYIEPLLTKSKPENDSTHNRRVVFSYLMNKEAVKELFSTVSAKIADRPGGYTRIIKLGTRPGDGAEMALIELVDFNEVYGVKVEAKAKTRRSRRGSGTGAKASDIASETVEATDVLPVVAAAEIASEVSEESTHTDTFEAHEAETSHEAIEEATVAQEPEAVEAAAEPVAEEPVAVEAAAEEAPSVEEPTSTEETSSATSDSADAAGDSGDAAPEAPASDDVKVD